MDERTRRVAENESLFRQVNEHVVAGGDDPQRTSRSSANVRTRVAWITFA